MTLRNLCELFCFPENNCHSAWSAKAKIKGRESVTCRMALWLSLIMVKVRSASRSKRRCKAYFKLGRELLYLQKCGRPRRPIRRRQSAIFLGSGSIGVIYAGCMVTVYMALNPADAQLVRSRLEAASFHPVVTNELSALSLDGYALA